MHKIVIDTNVIVSALIAKGYPSQILNNFILEKKAILCISDAILEEYINVLSRNKFARHPDFKINADIIIATIEKILQKNTTLTSKLIV